MVCKGLATLGLDITVSTIICIAVFVIDFYNQVKTRFKIKISMVLLKVLTTSMV